jgi:hypothetical protein
MTATENLQQEIDTLHERVSSLEQQLLSHGIRPKDWRDPREPDEAQYDELLRIVQQRFPV